MLSTRKQKFQKRNDSNFLAQIGHLFCNLREPRQEILVLFNSFLEIGDFAVTETQKHLVKPLKVGAYKAVQNLFVKLILLVEMELTSSAMLKMCLPNSTAIPILVAHCLCSSTDKSEAGVYAKN